MSDLVNRGDKLDENCSDESAKRVRYELNTPVRQRRTNSTDLSHVYLRSEHKGQLEILEEEVEDEVSVEQQKTNKWKVLQVVSVFMVRSSVHAVSQVGQARTGWKRAFWLLVLTASFCGCCYEVTHFLRVYFRYPVLIDAVVERVSPRPPFPAVTVCSLNRMNNQHYDCLMSGKSWRDCQKEWLKPTFYSGRTTLVFSERAKVTKVQNAALREKASNFLNIYSRIDPSTRKCYGYRVEELVHRCSFDRRVCTHLNFTHFYSLQYGNCYTFRATTNHPRDLSGLELDLYVNRQSYLDITPAAGMMVVVHDPEEDPRPSEEGVTISPGFETHLSLTLNTVSRLPAPYRDRCINYDRSSPVTEARSPLDCTRTCQQKTNVAVCGCADSLLTPHHPAPCDLRNDTLMTCLDGVLRVMTDRGLPCECPLPCVQSTYRVQVSSSAVYDQDYVKGDSFGYTLHPECKVMYKIFDLSYNRKKRVVESRQKRWPFQQPAKSSYAKLRVFYGTNEHTTFAQRPMFNDSEFLAHLGGNLGLWLGLSLVAVFEYVEGIVLLLNHCFRRSKP